jgi:DNA-binding beta-propeller fold protein YncE
MKKMWYFLVFAGAGFLSHVMFAGTGIVCDSNELLNHPKDIVYDQVRHCFYITNYAGNNVVTMDSLGNFEEMLNSLPGPMGLALFNDTLIISSSSPATITAVNVTTGDILYQLTVPEATYLSHMDVDPRTNLVYIIEQQGGIIKLNYRLAKYTVFVPLYSGLAYGSQTIEVDTTNYRLLVFQWDPGYIKAINLADSTQVTNACNQGISQVHASESVPTGEIYVSRYYNNSIYRYEADLSESPVLIASGFCQPAGLTYNPDNNMLYVCNYGCNTIDMVPLFPTGYGDFPEPSQVYNIFPNPAKSAVSLEFDLKFAGELFIFVTDLQGRDVIRSNYMLPAGEHLLTLPIEILKPGTYLFTLKDELAAVLTKKLIIKQ